MLACTRRQFLQGSLALAGLGLLTGCSRLRSPARGSARPPRVGYLSGGSRTSGSQNEETFRQALRELGYTDGETVAIDSRYAEDQSGRLPALAAELIRLRVDVIVTEGPAAMVARQASTTTPIVMATVGDPVGSGLVASLARPGGNVTGFVLTTPGLSAKRLELFKETVPALSRVAALWDPTSPATSLSDTQAAARSLRVDLQVLEIRSPDDLEGAFELARRERADGLASLGGALLISVRRRIVDFATRQRLPSMFPQREYAVDGGLLGYGPNVAHNSQRAAVYVDKILKGAKPAELPVEQPTKFDFVVNLKTAQELGQTIPPSILQQATEVIQ
jgi:putative ABC transport system substrate-binding protein